jgi:hypothetical protein
MLKLAALVQLVALSALTWFGAFLVFVVLSTIALTHALSIGRFRK